MLKCSELLRKNTFASYSEFYFACCMGAVLGGMGRSLDMSDMIINSDILSSRELDYFRFLVKAGSIEIGDVPKDGVAIPPEDVHYYLDMDKFLEINNVLVENRKTEYYWSRTWVVENYPSSPVEFKSVSKIGILLMHILAYLFISEVTGKIETKPFRVQLSEQDAKNTYFYIDLVSCTKTMPWLNQYLVLDINFGSFIVDLNYLIFYNNASVAGKHGGDTIGKKHYLMEKYGICVGSIVELWTRSHINASNRVGKIESVKIARIDEIGSDFIGLTTISVNKTKEELQKDYDSIEEGRRHLFADLPNITPRVAGQVIKLYELGIMDHFKDETQFITTIDPSGSVSKCVTIDGVVGDVVMSEVDAIYWLLCQYNFEFDHEMYRGTYADGGKLLWDRYGVEEPAC